MKSSLEQQIDLAIDILKNGGVVAFPTDTVYGLGADSRNEDAIRRIYRVKNRSLSLALPLLLADKSEITLVAGVVPEIAWRLAECFFPGGLTLVLKKAAWVSNTITAGGDTVAARVPHHPIPLAIIRGVGAPLVGTSANLSGMPSPVTAREVFEQLGTNVDLIVDGGKCPGGVESTIIDVTGNSPLILREGAISRHDLEEVCGIALAEN